MQVSLKSILPISTDLTFDQHLKSVSGQCFYQLRQLRSVRQSPDTESITTVIRAFVSSRVDYCCSLLIGSPRSVTDKLQRVLNAAARVITNTKKYESGLSRTLHHDLHWLNVTERIQFRLPSGCNSRAYISVCAAWLQRTWLNCVRQLSWRSLVRHNQQLGRTTLQTVNLRHPCVQCRWSSLLECFTGLFKVVRLVVRWF